MPPDVIHSTEVQVERKGCHPPTSINILSDDELLEIFDCYRLHNSFGWDNKWWYKLMHTCRRWRYIILESSTSLQLRLYCKPGMPIADMLKFSPPLPPEIMCKERPMSTKDEEGMLLALQQHHRVRFISLNEPALQKLLSVLDKPFPMLEYLSLSSSDPHDRSRVPETFSAPRLRHLYLVQVGDVFARGIPWLASITRLVNLSLEGIPSVNSLPVEYLASRLSLMPQLEFLTLEFDDSELAASELPHFGSLQNYESPPAETEQVLLPKLNEVAFRGHCTYLEGLVSYIRAPRLEYFLVEFFQRPSIHLPRLSEFIAAAEDLRYPVSYLSFSGVDEDDPSVLVTVARSIDSAYLFPQDAQVSIRFPCRSHLDEQVASVAIVCTALSPMLSEAEMLNIGCYPTRSSRGFPPGPEIPREVWYMLLRPFCRVKKLELDSDMARMLSFALCPEGGPIMEGVLPKLCKFSPRQHAGFRGLLDPFIAARRAAGQLIAERRPPANSDSESDEYYAPTE